VKGFCSGLIITIFPLMHGLVDSIEQASGVHFERVNLPIAAPDRHRAVHHRHALARITGRDAPTLPRHVADVNEREQRFPPARRGAMMLAEIGSTFMPQRGQPVKSGSTTPD
jgi:hypothetical protein